MGDAAGQLTDRLHLLDLAQLRLGGLALLGLGLERLVRLPQFLGPVADRIFKRLGALGLAFGLAAGGVVLAKRLDGDHAEEHGAETDDDFQPAQIIGKSVRLGRREQAFLDALTERRALGPGDLLELVVELLAGPRFGSLVEIADPALALARQSRAGSERELIAALVVQALELGHAPLLLGIAAHQLGELADLEAGEIPVGGVDRPVFSGPRRARSGRAPLRTGRRWS